MINPSSKLQRPFQWLESCDNLRAPLQMSSFHQRFLHILGLPRRFPVGSCVNRAMMIVLMNLWNHGHRIHRHPYVLTFAWKVTGKTPNQSNSDCHCSFSERRGSAACRLEVLLCKARERTSFLECLLLAVFARTHSLSSWAWLYIEFLIRQANSFSPPRTTFGKPQLQTQKRGVLQRRYWFQSFKAALPWKNRWWAKWGFECTGLGNLKLNHRGFWKTK